MPMSYYAEVTEPNSASNVRRIARVCHEVLRAYCKAIGEMSYRPWEEAPEWQRESAVEGVRFHLGDPDAKPSDSHDNWLAQKAAGGWTYGEAKDPEAKTHPCMVAFSDLPVEQQAKDYIFRAIVRALA